MLKINNPYIVIKSGGAAVLVSEADLNNLQSMATQAQIVRGGKVSPVQPLQVIYKFLHDFVELVPPQPWGNPNV